MSAKDDPRYGKPQPDWVERIIVACFLLHPAIIIAYELINP